MTEINTSISAKVAQQSNSSSGIKLTNARANSIQGLASGMNTRKTIDAIMQVEQRRAEPIKSRKVDTQVELESFKVVQSSLETLQTSSQLLAEKTIWEGKVVESSNDEVVSAIATTGAKPGKHTLVVDRLALNHQIASQGFEESDTVIGKGNFKITTGDESSVTIVLDETNNTLTGINDAINHATEEVNSTIIKTGDKERPYQLVLTSKNTGEPGRITLDIDLSGGEAPTFENFVEDPSEWNGVGPEDLAPSLVTGVGASTSVIRVVGEYSGEEDLEFIFTAVQTGLVGGENAMQLRWEDNTGRSDVIELDSLNYAPGEPIEFADGLSLIFSQGEMIVADEFRIKARAEKSDLLWWLPEGQRGARVTQPSSWNRQATFGAPVVEGTYTGAEDKKFTLKVTGSGQIGTSSSLMLNWDSNDGRSGRFRIGRGYKPGSKLALADGLTVTINPGVLNEGQEATFDVAAQETSAKWWLDDEERVIPSEILNVSKFSEAAVPEEKEEFDEFGVETEFPEDLGPRTSSADPILTGKFQGDEAKVYTFTATRDGAMGTTKDLELSWVDDKGNTGKIAVGDTYSLGDPIPFDSGLFMGFNSGRVFKDDFFTVRTRTSTIQPAQNALIRFGATELGGGLEITNDTNELADVIPGVKLNLLSAEKKPVTITIKGETDKAVDSIRTFAEDYNHLASIINELTKFDPDTKEAGPLLGDRNLNEIRNELSQLLIDPVPGLPQSMNMLFALGLKLDAKGLLTVDEETLNNKVQDDFAGVADLFRNKGETENTGISFISMTDETVAKPEGYEVDISRAATQGQYESPPLPEIITISELNDIFLITVNGKESEEIELEQGQLSLDEYARILQNKITNDDNIGGMGVRVILEESRLRIISGRFGSRSSIAIAPDSPERQAGVGLTSGMTRAGSDVVGRINKEPAQGIGKLLRGSETSKNVKGIRLLVNLTENQVNPAGPEATVKVTRGVGARVFLNVQAMLDPIRGNMHRITANLRDQVENYDVQLEQLAKRMESKRARLETKFVRMEVQLSSLKSQQNFMTTQLGGLPKSKSGGILGK